MSVTIFWCEWNEKKVESHDLLRQAFVQYRGETSVAFFEEQPSRRDDAQADEWKRVGRNDANLSGTEHLLPVYIKKTEHGKPYFENDPQVRFSISHSENLWACAFGDTEIGLDLQSEYMKNGEKIARRFFHPEEIAWMERNGFHHFSRIWTHKESYVKFTGMGLTRGLDYFSVVPWLDGSVRILSCDTRERAHAKEHVEKSGCRRGLSSEASDGVRAGGTAEKIGCCPILSGEATDFDGCSEPGNRICQQEIPFREGYWMVLSAGTPQEISVSHLDVVRKCG